MATIATRSVLTILRLKLARKSTKYPNSHRSHHGHKLFLHEYKASLTFRLFAISLTATIATITFFIIPHSGLHSHRSHKAYQPIFYRHSQRCPRATVALIATMANKPRWLSWPAGYRGHKVIYCGFLRLTASSDSLHIECEYTPIP